MCDKFKLPGDSWWWNSGWTSRSLGDALLNRQDMNMLVTMEWDMMWVTTDHAGILLKFNKPANMRRKEKSVEWTWLPARKDWWDVLEKGTKKQNRALLNEFKEYMVTKWIS